VAAFIFSRFVAGMAKQAAWQNLRGGAASMVGTSLLCLLIAVGIGFRFFENESVMTGIGYAIPVFMLVIAAEILLNFILNLYRPRIPGEVPRPAFDSKMLSLFAAPDNLVRSINEAVNYQFGFDVTSTWGYQLLLRSFAWLIAIGVVSLILLNTMVIVEPHQQAVKLSSGRIVGEVHGAGIMWKLPWPFQSAEVHDVSRVRTLDLTARISRLEKPVERYGNDWEINLWQDKLQGRTNMQMEPFIVGASSLEVDEQFLEDADVLAEGQVQVVAEDVSNKYSLVMCEITLEYRIRSDGDGLKRYLMFAPDIFERRQRLNERERTLTALALDVVNDELSRRSLDDVLALGRVSLAQTLVRQVQAQLDQHDAGVEVVAVNFPSMRPIDGTADDFVDLGYAIQQRLERLADARRTRATTRIYDVGDEANLEPVLQAIAEWERLRRLHGPDAPETIAQRLAVEQMLFEGGGGNALTIALAEKERWVKVLEARTRARRIEGQLPAYRAAPALYRQREVMRVLTARLVNARKYVLGIDPQRFNIDVELRELNPLTNIQDAFLKEGEVPNE